MRAGVQLNWIDPNLSWAGVNQRWLSGSHMAVCWWESPIWLNQNARAVCRCFSLHLLRLKEVQSGSRMSSGGAWEERRLQSFNSLHLSKFVSSALYNRSWLMPWDKMSGHHQQGTWISHLHNMFMHMSLPTAIENVWCFHCVLASLAKIPASQSPAVSPKGFPPAPNLQLLHLPHNCIFYLTAWKSRWGLV